jgi:hypothetical protein
LASFIKDIRAQKQSPGHILIVDYYDELADVVEHAINITLGKL